MTALSGQKTDGSQQEQENLTPDPIAALLESLPVDETTRDASAQLTPDEIYGSFT